MLFIAVLRAKPQDCPSVDLDLRNVLLLDNQSTFDLCCNKKFTSQVMKATNALTMTSNGGGLKITEKMQDSRL